MPSSLHPRRKTSHRPIAGVTALAVAATVLLAGCAPTTGEPAGPGAEPGGSQDLTWIDIDYPASMGDGRYGHGFSAGGAFWVYDSEDPTTLHGTRDGATWRTLDLIDDGVPATDGGYRSNCVDLVVGNASSPAFSVLYHTPYGQGHPDGLSNHTWIAEIGPGSVTVSDAAAIGLETMPPKQSGLAYRTNCALGLEELGETRVIVGIGQWWKPFSTNDSNPYVAVEDSPGQWTIHASTVEPFFKSTLYPLRVVKTAERFVVLARSNDAASTFIAWSSADGLTWSSAEYPGAPIDVRTNPPYVSANDHGIATWNVAKADGSNRASLWVSRDAVTWNYSEPLDGDWHVTAVRIFEDGFRVFADGTGDDGTEVSGAWHSTDGVDWVFEKDVNLSPEGSASAIPHEGGFIIPHSRNMSVIGLPWGAP